MQGYTGSFLSSSVSFHFFFFRFGVRGHGSSWLNCSEPSSWYVRYCISYSAQYSTVEVLLGCGSIAQSVLSLGHKGDFFSINWGWGVSAGLAHCTC